MVETQRMGHFQRTLSAKFKFGATAVQAAKEMYAHVMRGAAFEIPAALNTDDKTTRAVLALKHIYPNVPVVFQSRGIIIGQVQKTMKVSKEAWDKLDSAGYLPPEEVAKNANEFLSRHEAFMKRNEQDVSANIAEAQRRQAERDAIVVDSGVALKAEQPTTFADGRTFTEVEKENELQRAAEAEKRKSLDIEVK